MIRNMQIRSKLIAVLVIPLVAPDGAGRHRHRGQRRPGRAGRPGQRPDGLRRQPLHAGARAAAGAGPVRRLGRERPRRRLRRRRRPAGGGQPGAPDLPQGRGEPRPGHRGLGVPAAGRRRALRRFDRLNEERQRIEADPAWTVARTLDFYSGQHRQPVRRGARARRRDRRPQPDPQRRHLRLPRPLQGGGQPGARRGLRGGVDRPVRPRRVPALRDHARRPGHLALPVRHHRQPRAAPPGSTRCSPTPTSPRPTGCATSCATPS